MSWLRGLANFFQSHQGCLGILSMIHTALRDWCLLSELRACRIQIYSRSHLSHRVREDLLPLFLLSQRMLSLKTLRVILSPDPGNIDSVSRWRTEPFHGRPYVTSLQQQEKLRMGEKKEKKIQPWILQILLLSKGIYASLSIYANILLIAYSRNCTSGEVQMWNNPLGPWQCNYRKYFANKFFNQFFSVLNTTPSPKLNESDEG